MSTEKKTKSNAVPGASSDQENALAVSKGIAAAGDYKPVAKPGSLKLAEQTINAHAVLIDVDVTPDDILRPEFWCHEAAKMTSLALITVINRLKGWEANIRVVEVGKGWARVVLLSKTDWETVSKDTAEVSRIKLQYKIQPRSDGWRVIDPSGQAIISGLTSENEANKFVDDLLATMNAKAA